MPPLNLIQVFFLFVIGQGVFLSTILVISKKGDRTANRLLATFVFLITFYTFTFFLYDTGYRRFIPILPINGYSIVPLIPVIFYFYLKQITGGNLGARPLLHLIPFILQFLYWVPNNTSGLFHTLAEESFSIYYSQLIVRSVSGVHMLILAIYGFVFFRYFDFRDQNERAEKRKWIRKLRILYVIITCLFCFGTITLWFVETDVVRYMFFLFVSFVIYLIGYTGYAQSGILFHLPEKIRPKYYHSNLTPDESKALYQNLIKLIEKDKLYLDQHLKLGHISRRLGTNVHDLSRAINENSGQKFHDFVNHYRIQEAKKILSDDQKANLKMYAVALDSGFSNKVSFYKNFKKFTGCLPMEYRSRKSAVLEEIMG